MPIEQKKIKNIDLPNLHPNSPDTDTDYRSEIIAASLINRGYDPEQIQIIRKGTARRGFSKEVEEVFEQFSTHVLMDYLYIKTNKEGLYDMLPQGLFHQPVHKKKFIKDKEDALEEIKIHREEEFYARRFFQPFEIATDETLTEAHLYEARYNKKISQPEFTNLFVPFWPILQLLERYQANYFMYIIPLLHQIRNNREDHAMLRQDSPVQIDGATQNLQQISKQSDKLTMWRKPNVPAAASVQDMAGLIDGQQLSQPVVVGSMFHGSNAKNLGGGKGNHINPHCSSIS